MSVRSHVASLRLAALFVVATLAACPDPNVGGDDPVGLGTADGSAGAIQCSTDDDCPFGQVCDDGTCRPSDQNLHDEGCETDADCGEGEQCAASTGRCVPQASMPDVPVPETGDCVDGQTRLCGSKVGVCEYGEQRCVDGVWGTECFSEIGPSAEKCDALDNDCDGATDEEWVLGEGCARGTGACLQTGTMICTADGSTTACSVDALPSDGRQELCENGVDDDCDAETDEGFVLDAACSEGTGACFRAGVTVCTDDRLGTRCSAVAAAPGAAELCGNFADDNCDGATDEGYGALGDACTRGQGACRRDGSMVCSQDLLQVHCSVTEGTAAPAELCGNNIDDNCDGATDEGFAALNEACSRGIGACLRNGSIVCTADLLGTQCSVTEGQAAAADLCGNNIDDNCDGATDEGFERLSQPCSDGVGACQRTGSYVCTADLLTTACSVVRGTPAAADLCGNNVDDNCDGNTDEGFEALGSPCEDGAGACHQAGTMLCSPDLLEVRCSAQALAAQPFDVCGNNVDDNCDGTTDEGFATLGDECSDGTGACLRTGTIQCTPDLRQVRCSVSAGPPGADELCGNNVDDNCDGTTDEEFAGVIGTPCQVGTGACVPRGTWACTADQTDKFCAIPVVGDETCNLLDDDLDACTDEDFDVGAVCSAGVGACRRSGVKVCNGDGTDTTCGATAGTPAPAELCGNTSDDNCNGQTDEGFDVGLACSVGTGACQRSGNKQCTGDRLGTECSATAGTPGPRELCGNSVDDDCDTATDEGFDVGTGCSVGRGVCVRNGVKRCSADATTTVCDATPGTAGSELCSNSLDDDCDGSTDEGFNVGSPCSAGTGVCRRSGVMQCTADGLGTECSVTAGTPTTGELCGNNLDDNCDGSTDENFDVGAVCSAGTGVCRQSGVKQCTADRLSTVCSVSGGTPNPAGELCGNNLDDDCDTNTDEGYDTGTVCSAGTGVCRQSGVKQCTADRLATVCSVSGGTPTTGELCGNNLDDDCDTVTDEGFDVGTACSAGTGYCLRNGTKVCTADLAGTRCSATAGNPNPSGELCGNNVDDDCDTTTDEGYNVGTACSAGTGACLRNGSFICSLDRLSTVCNATAGTAGTELCSNSIDDDCDSFTDEGFSNLGTSCTNGSGACARNGNYVCSGDRLSTVCNATPGTPNAEICDNVDNDCNSVLDDGCDDDDDDYCDAAMTITGVPSVCPLTTNGTLKDCNDTNAAVNPGAAEVCGDNRDQDCDGDNNNGCGCGPTMDVDLDGYRSIACGGNDCDDSNGSIHPGATERCDGVDNDCDGILDEGFDADGDNYTTCGTVRPGGGLDPSYVDCDDNNAQRKPFACELCATASGTVACGAVNDRGNNIDEDCDGYKDETCAPCDLVDRDGDGLSQCEGDCAPADGTVRPGRAEVCDGKDTDCNQFTRDNCDVGNRCNWPGYPTSSDPAPDACKDRLVCVESLAGNGRGTGNFTCTSFCNFSPAGLGLGDGCTAAQTCSSRLTPTANLHGCTVNSEIGTKSSGQTCGSDAECRSDFCLRDDRFTGNVKYCTDLCGSDAYCSSGTTCQVQGAGTAATTARCERLTGYQTKDTGASCTGASEYNYCKGGAGACVASGTGRICTEACCRNSDCPAGYYCSLKGNDYPGPNGGYDTVPVCYPYGSGAHNRAAGAACNANSDCASEFCDRTLSVCVDVCCNDAVCPTGLTCESAIVTRASNHQGFARVCVNLTPSEPLQPK